MSFDAFKILEEVKKEFNLEFIKFYIENNYADYLEEEELEEFENSEYDSMFDYYALEGIGGNGFEGDIMTMAGDWAAEKFGITDDELWSDDDFRYGMDYYILEHFPTYYFVDYRKKNNLDDLMSRFDNL